MQSRDKRRSVMGWVDDYPVEDPKPCRQVMVFERAAMIVRASTKKLHWIPCRLLSHTMSYVAGLLQA